MSKFEEQIKEQGNACAICHRSFSKFTAFQDHDHACCPRRFKNYCGLCNRGAICFLCNKKAVAAMEFMVKVGIDPENVLDYIAHWGEILKARGAYAEKKTPKRAKRKKARVRKAKKGL